MLYKLQFGRLFTRLIWITLLGLVLTHIPRFRYKTGSTYLGIISWEQDEIIPEQILYFIH